MSIYDFLKLQRNFILLFMFQVNKWLTNIKKEVLGRILLKIVNISRVATAFIKKRKKKSICTVSIIESAEIVFYCKT